MHRQSQEEVAAAARRRLEMLGRELDAAGLRRVEEPPESAAQEADEPGGDDPLPPPARVAPVGRHLRAPRTGRLGHRFGGWLGDQVPDTLRGRVRLEAGPALLVVALVSLAAVATVFVVLRVGGDAEAVPSRARLVTSGSATPLVPSSTPGAGGGVPAVPGPSTGPVPASPAASAGGTVTVDVAGKVRRPGVATLPTGSRVVDALKQAGGPRGGVDLAGLNLARVLVDGEQILVGRAAQAAAGSQPGGLAASASTAAPDASGPLVNLNTATAAQLDTLPGVGPVTAQKILDWRGTHGAFSSVDELLEIDGIGEKTLADIAPHVTL